MTTAQRRRPGSGAAQRQQRKIPWLAIAFGAVAVALVAAVLLSSDEPIGSEFGEVTVTGQSLPPMQDGAADPAIGVTAPSLAGTDFDGDAVAITAGGTPKGIVFLAHWCQHCRAEVPRVQAWLDSGGGVDGVELYSVSTSMNSAQPNYPASAWLENEGWTVPLIRDDQDSTAMAAFGGGAFPYWVFLDADGNVVRRSSGQLEISTLEAYLTETK